MVSPIQFFERHLPHPVPQAIDSYTIDEDSLCVQHRVAVPKVSSYQVNNAQWLCFDSSDTERLPQLMPLDGGCTSCSLRCTTPLLHFLEPSLQIVHEPRLGWCDHSPVPYFQTTTMTLMAHASNRLLSSHMPSSAAVVRTPAPDNFDPVLSQTQQSR